MLTTDRYGSSYINPVWREWHMYGTIIQTPNSFYNCFVMWDNGARGDYRDEDLTVITDHVIHKKQYVDRKLMENILEVLNDI